jgi:hypothetical protein
VTSTSSHVEPQEHADPALVAAHAWEEMCDGLKQIGHLLTGEAFPVTAEERAEGYAHLAHLAGEAMS